MGSLEDRSSRWAVILAGGEGLRLRALTRRLAGDERPKQFCAILGAETLLDQTRRRVALAIAPERTTIVVTRAHQRFYAPLLADVLPARLVEQARSAGTASAVLYGLLRTAATAPAAPVAVFPSDHHVSDDPLFMAHVQAAFQAVAARPDLVVLLGIIPDAAETEYGWIEPGAPLPVGGTWTVSRIRRFWEKPPLVVAQALLAKDCLWNSFVMVGTVPTLLAMVGTAMPRLCEAFRPLREVVGTPREQHAASAVYARTPSRDFSREVLAIHPSNLAVLPVRGVEWTDLGDPRRALATLSRVRLGGRPDPPLARLA
jgi:mannose-1-phosphate guanylyltransferase